MSLHDDDRYTWRETYFVLFQPDHRPRTEKLRRCLEKRAGTFRVLDEQSNKDGLLRSLTIASYEDHSALEIQYRVGKNISAETGALLEILEQDCSPEERQRLRKIKACQARFDVQHFEQTAETGAFQIVKIPEITFAPRQEPKNPSSRYVRKEDGNPCNNGGIEPGKNTENRDNSAQGVFPKTASCDRLGDDSDSCRTGRTPRFHFDPNSFENCRFGNRPDDTDDDDSAILERIDPNTLVLVLEVLCKISGGTAIDPASGMII